MMSGGGGGGGGGAAADDDDDGASSLFNAAAFSHVRLRGFLAAGAAACAGCLDVGWFIILILAFSSHSSHFGFPEYPSSL